MRTVGRSDMVRTRKAGLVDEVDVFEAFHRLGHLPPCHRLFGCLEFVVLPVEVAALAVDRLHEDQRRLGKRLPDTCDEGNQPFGDHLGIGIRKSVEDHRIGVLHIGEVIGEIGLELAVTAAGDAAEVKPRIAGDLHRVAHARTAGADAVREARTEDHDLVAERILHRYDLRVLIHADLQRGQFVVVGQIQQALLLGAVHPFDHRERLAALAGSARRGVDPLAVLADVEVEALGSYPRGAGTVVDERGVLGQQVDARGIGLEHQRQARAAAHLLVLGLGEALVSDRIDPVVRVRRRQRLADQIEFGGVDEPHLRGRRPDRQQCDGE